MEHAVMLLVGQTSSSPLGLLECLPGMDSYLGSLSSCLGRLVKARDNSPDGLSLIR